MSCSKLNSRFTTFKATWLDEEDEDGNALRKWLKKDGEEGYGFCFVCRKKINVKSGGFSRVKDHAKAADHKKNILALKGIPMLDAVVQKSQKSVDKISDKVLRAEICWSLFTASHDLPFVLADDIGETLKKMFPDSQISQNLKIKRQKASYLTSFGVAKHINDDILNKQLCNQKHFLMIDEGSINYSRKWLALLIRHYEPNSAAVLTDFLSIVSLGDASAKTLMEAISNELASRRIPLKNCLGVMSDSANVMRGKKGGVIALLKKENSSIIDIGGCAMHHVHNSAAKAMVALGEELEVILDDIFFYLRYAKAANSFEELQTLMDLEPLKFLRRVESRWLQISEVTSRFKILLPVLKKFFSALSQVEQNKDRVRRIRKYLDSPDTLVYINFVLFSLKPLKEFETFFQSSQPVIHLLYNRMISIVANVCRSFIRSRHIQELMNFEEFQEIHVDHELPDDELLIGEDSRCALRNDHISAIQRALFFERVRQFYRTLLRSLIHYLPIGQRLLRTVQFIDPSQKENVLEADLVHVMKQLSVKGDPDQLLLEWRQFVSDVTLFHHKDASITAFWNQVKACGKYELLVNLAECALILPHGNADTERMFSSLKRILTADRNKLQDPNLNGLLTVKSYMLNRGYNSATMPITEELLERCHDAGACYNAFLKAKQKERIEEEAKREAIRKAQQEAEEIAKAKKAEFDLSQQIAEKKRQTAMDYMEAAKKLMREAQELTIDTAKHQSNSFRFPKPQSQKRKVTDGQSSQKAGVEKLKRTSTNQASNCKFHVF